MSSATPHGSAKRNVLIFRKDLLPYSETFIPAQAEYFQSFIPIYVGLRRMKGLPLPEERIIVPVGRTLPGRANPEFTSTLRQAKPALMHAHFEDGGIWGLPVAQSLKIPLVVTCHGYDVTQMKSGWRSWPLVRQYRDNKRKALFLKFALCIGISRFICDQMLLRGYPSGKIRLHYIGVDVDRFRPDPDVPKQAMILFVGRLVEKKGCADLLRAMQKVNARYPDVKLKICGSGPLQTDLEAFAREAKINVDFCGVQSPEAIQGMLKSAMMLCIPSVRARSGDSEGLGIVNLEAQASGVPVIGTLHGGIPESVEHGVTGLLSAERDSDALAENILALLSDTQLREKMGAAARQRMVQHFNLTHQSSLLEKIYLELL